MNIQRELDVLSAAFAARLREKLTHPDLPADERQRIEGLLRKMAEADLQRAVDQAPPIDVEKFVKGLHSAAVAKAVAAVALDIMDGLTQPTPSSEPPTQPPRG